MSLTTTPQQLARLQLAREIADVERKEHVARLALAYMCEATTRGVYTIADLIAQNQRIAGFADQAMNLRQQAHHD